MSVLKGKVVKTKAKFQRHGKNVKNIKVNENQNNKQSPTSIKAVKDQKIEKVIKNSQCDETQKSKNSPSTTNDTKVKNGIRNTVKDQYNHKLQDKICNAERNKNEISFMERNSKGNITKSFQTEDNSESEFESASDDEVLESDITEDEQAESDDIEDEVEMNNDDEEIENDSEFEEMESDVEDVETESDDEDEEMESDDEEIENDAKDEDVESNTKIEDGGSKSTKGRESGKANNTVFVSNLDNDLDRDTIQKYFEKAGEVHSVHFLPQHNKPGYAFVKMSDSKGFQEALWLNSTLLSGRRINVKPYGEKINKMLRRDGRSVDGTNPKGARYEKKMDQCGINNTVFVANLNINLDEETVRKHFEKAGEVSKVHLFLRHKPAYGFIEMSDSNGFQKALSLNLTMLLGRRIHVEWKKTKEMLKNNKKIEGISAKGINLKSDRDRIKNRIVLVSNLNNSIDEKIIRKYFEKAGEIHDVKLRHKQRIGLVSMSNSNGFERALSLHGTMLLGQRICVRPYRPATRTAMYMPNNGIRHANYVKDTLVHDKDNRNIGRHISINNNRNIGHRICVRPYRPATRTAMYMPNNGIRHAKYVKDTLVHDKDNRNIGRRISINNNRNIGHRISFEQSNKKTSRCDTCSSNNKYVKGRPVARMNPKYNGSPNNDKRKDMLGNANQGSHVRRTPVINKSTLTDHAEKPVEL